MVDLFAYVGGTFSMVSLMPQILKSMQTGSTRDISWLSLVATFGSSAAYQIYALLLWLVPVIIMNGIFAVTAAVLIAVKWRFDGIGLVDTK